MKTSTSVLSVTSSASSSRKTSEARSELDWEELCQTFNTFGLEEEQVRSSLPFFIIWDCMKQLRNSPPLFVTLYQSINCSFSLKYGLT